MRLLLILPLVARVRARAPIAVTGDHDVIPVANRVANRLLSDSQHASTQHKHASTPQHQHDGPLPPPPTDGLGPLQVFIMAGQSNMMGYGLVTATASHRGNYTLDALVRRALTLPLPFLHPNPTPYQVRSGASEYQHLRDPQTGELCRTYRGTTLTPTLTLTLTLTLTPGEWARRHDVEVEVYHATS